MIAAETSNMRNFLEQGDALTYQCMQLAVELHQLHKVVLMACKSTTLPKFRILNRQILKVEADLHAALERLDVKLLQVHRSTEHAF